MEKKYEELIDKLKNAGYDGELPDELIQNVSGGTGEDIPEIPYPDWNSPEDVQRWVDELCAMISEHKSKTPDGMLEYSVL